MLRDGRYRYVAQRGRDHLISAGNCAAWVAAPRAAGSGTVWIGDSHAGYLTKCFSTANVLRSADGDQVLHLGARLMHSISHAGFPRWVIRLLELESRVGRRPRALVLCLGEIDVRCHLAVHLRDGEVDLSFVGAYVSRALELGRSCGAECVAFVVPPPPCVDQLDAARFPVRGTFAERTRVFDALRARLDQEVADQASATPAVVIDCTDALWDPVHGMRPELSDDRCHANSRGADIVRRALGNRLATGIVR